MKTYYLKLFKLYILVVCLGLFTTSCDELTMALQYANQSNGGVCLETEGTFGYFNKTDQDYRMNRYRANNDSGESIAEKELNWINSRVDYYLSNIGIYYDTSPYSNAEYKIVITCVTWSEPNQYVSPPIYNSPGRN